MTSDKPQMNYSGYVHKCYSLHAQQKVVCSTQFILLS